MTELLNFVGFVGTGKSKAGSPVREEARRAC